MPLIDGFDSFTAATLVFIFAILLAVSPSGNPAAGGALLFGPAQLITAPLSLLGGLGGIILPLAVIAFLAYLSVMNGFVGEAVIGVAVLSFVAFMFA